MVGQQAGLIVDGLVHIHHGDIALAQVDLERDVAALAVLGQIVQAQGLQRGALLPVDALGLAAVAVVADTAVAVVDILQVLGLVAGVDMDIGEQHDDVGEGQRHTVAFIDGVAPGAVVGIVLLHLVAVGGRVVQHAGLIAGGVGDLDILAVGDDRAVVFQRVGAVQAVGQVAHRVLLAVIDKVEEGGVVVAVHIDVLIVDIFLDVFAAGVHRVLDGQAGVVGLAEPVGAVVVAVAVGAVVVVERAVVIVAGILLHDDTLAFVDIQPLPGQDELEELVAAGAHGADLLDVMVVVIHSHEAGDAAFDLDLEQHLRRRKTALRARARDVVDHHGGDALAGRIVGVAGLAGQGVGLVGRQGRGRDRGGFRLGRSIRRGGLDALVFGAGRQHHARRQHRQHAEQKTLHSLILFSCFGGDGKMRRTHAERAGGRPFLFILPAFAVFVKPPGNFLHSPAPNPRRKPQKSLVCSGQICYNSKVNVFCPGGQLPLQRRE